MNGMAFHDHEYDLYAILASSGESPVWTFDQWQKVTKIIEPVTISQRGKSGIRVTQLDSNQRGIKFGRLSLTAESNEKWTHNSPIVDSRNWLFLDVEIWSPIWTICERQKKAPDFFLSVFNESWNWS
jgi:hypothetical protein